jgi:hypothetical protein
VEGGKEGYRRWDMSTKVRSGMGNAKDRPIWDNCDRLSAWRGSGSDGSLMKGVIVFLL